LVIAREMRADWDSLGSMGEKRGCVRLKGKLEGKKCLPPHSQKGKVFLGAGGLAARGMHNVLFLSQGKKTEKNRNR